MELTGIDVEGALTLILALTPTLAPPLTLTLTLTRTLTLTLTRTLTLTLTQLSPLPWDFFAWHRPQEKTRVGA